MHAGSDSSDLANHGETMRIEWEYIWNLVGLYGLSLDTYIYIYVYIEDKHKKMYMYNIEKWPTEENDDTSSPYSWI